MKTDQKLSHTLKRICDTRWSSRAEAVLTVRMNFSLIRTVLGEICINPSEKPITKIQAKKLHSSFEDLETALLLIFWNTLLQRINAANKSLQNKECNIQKGTYLLKSLSAFILNIRTDDAYFYQMEKEAIELSGSIEYSTEKNRIRKRKIQFDETSDNDIILRGKELFKVETFYLICDTLHSEIKRRSVVYDQVLQNFLIFVYLDLSEEKFAQCVSNLVENYKDDINQLVFKDEVEQFLHFVKLEKILTLSEMYASILDGLTSTFPNVEIILNFFLTIPIANASGERSFSILKRVKNYLRTSLGQIKLNHLAIMAIEGDLLKKINYDSLIDSFSRNKSRKKI